MKIRTRLFLAFLLVVGLGFYQLVDWIVDDLRPRYLETMEESMIDTATILSSFLETSFSENAIDVSSLKTVFDNTGTKKISAKIYEVTKNQFNMRIYITDEKGIVIFDSDNGRDEGKDYSRWNDVIRTLRGEYGARTTRTDPDDPKTSTLYVASPIKIDGAIKGVLTVCKPSNSVTLFLQTARRKTVTAGIIAGAIVVLLGIVISIWITRPVQKLTEYAKAVRDGKKISTPKSGGSEIGELGIAFEEMRDALEGKQYVENYVQTLTHEMKSPLSAIKGAAELLDEDMPLEQRKQFLENIRAESARIQDLVDRLLELSSLEKRKELRDVEDIELTALLKEVSSSMAPILSAKRVSISIRQAAPINIRGERFLIRQSISNLIQNAADFSPEGGEISVSIEKNDEQIEISILDKSPGIPDYALDKVFDRFYSLKKPDTGKKSSGLGLTFVREAISLHGGDVKLKNRPDTGTKATLTLPSDS
ncbi:two-component system sensor histidine kinase CreC [Verrucomicrobiota bacterium]